MYVCKHIPKLPVGFLGSEAGILLRLPTAAIRPARQQRAPHTVEPIPAVTLWVEPAERFTRHVRTGWAAASGVSGGGRTGGGRGKVRHDSQLSANNTQKHHIRSSSCLTGIRARSYCSVFIAFPVRSVVWRTYIQSHRHTDDQTYWCGDSQGTVCRCSDRTRATATPKDHSSKDH